jgi:hypothetical protein
MQTATYLPQLPIISLHTADEIMTRDIGSGRKTIIGTCRVPRSAYSDSSRWQTDRQAAAYHLYRRGLLFLTLSTTP